MKKFMATVFECKTLTGLSFMASMLIYTIIALLFGERTVELMRIIQIFGLCVAVTLLQLTFFSGKVVKKMRYSYRMLLLLLFLLPLVTGAAILFRWVPAYPSAWIAFYIVFFVLYLGITVAFEIGFWVAGKNYDGLLNEYKAKKKKGT